MTGPYHIELSLRRYFRSLWHLPTNLRVPLYVRGGVLARCGNAKEYVGAYGANACMVPIRRAVLKKLRRAA